MPPGSGARRPPKIRRRTRIKPIIRFLLLLLLVNLGHPGSGLAAPGPGAELENLKYRVSLGVWSEVAQVHLRLTQVGPNRYRAEFSGAAEGMWRLLSRWLPEGYETDMVLEDGRLKPLVFREEFPGQRPSTSTRNTGSITPGKSWKSGGAWMAGSR